MFAYILAIPTWWQDLLIAAGVSVVLAGVVIAIFAVMMHIGAKQSERESDQ